MAGHRQRLLALGLGLALSLLPVVGGELWMRGQERDRGFHIPWDEPGRKFALHPRDGRSPLNDDGFNDREFGPKEPGTTRVVVLGDSVTFGAGVDMGDLWPRVAERLLGADGWQVELLNLSVFGYDMEQLAATLRYRGWELEPDLVLVATYTNDHIASRLVYLHDRSQPVFIGTELEPELVLTTEGLDLLSCRFSAMARRLHGGRVARYLDEQREQKGRDGGSHQKPGDYDWYGRHLEALARDAEARGVPVLAMGIGPHTLSRLEDEDCDGPLGPGGCKGSLEILRELHARAHVAGVPWFDSVPFYANAPESDFYREGSSDPHHPNAAGHAALGRAAAQALRQWRAGVDMDKGPAASEESEARPRKKAPNIRSGRSSKDERPRSRDRPPPVDTRASRKGEGG